MEIETIKSKRDGLELELAIKTPKTEPIGIVQIIHGMNQHKEKYFDFMEELVNNGYVAIIHDQRGHGNSVKDESHLGYFYTEDTSYLVDDAHQVTELIKERYPDLKVTIFAHSLGTLVTRLYMKKYDTEIDKVILTGPPGRKVGISFAIFATHISKLFYKKYQGNDFVNKLSMQNLNKKFDKPRAWICDNEQMAVNFFKDPKSNFTFTTNGFLILFKMNRDAFKKWIPNNKKLKIFLMGGSDDPVIVNKAKFEQTKKFISSLGYTSVKSKIYKGRRHDLINSKTKEEVINDILEFLKK